MKIQVKAMGTVDSIRDVPQHYSYNPTIELSAFSKLFTYAKKMNAQVLADELVDVIINDIQSDLETMPEAASAIKNYYSKYSKIIHANSNIISSVMIDDYDELITE